MFSAIRSFCLGAWLPVLDQKMDMLVADLIIGFQMFRESFTSYVKMDREALSIEVEYAEGPFKYLTNKWQFIEHEEGCIIDFYVDFEFKSRLLGKRLLKACLPKR